MLQLLKTCFGIKRDETVLIVTDDHRIEIAREIEKAAKMLSDEVILMKMKSRSHNAEEPPSAIAEAMLHADVVLAPTTMSLTHTDTRKNACDKGVRVATMPGITMEMLKKGGLLADYREVSRNTEIMAKLLTKAKDIQIKSDTGTNFKASLKGRKGMADTGIFRKKGKCGNLPAGEGFIAPVEGSGGGVLVFDGSFASLGVLKRPLTLRIEKGRVKKVKGYGADKLEKTFREFKHGNNVAEIGIGTNDRAKIIGNVLEDEKVYGTVHIALGDNHTFGGKVKAGIHLDGIITGPDVFLDGEKIIERGKFLCFQ